MCRHAKRYAIIGGVFVLIIFIGFFHTPRHFNLNTRIIISDGTSFSEAAQMLKNAQVITSATILRLAILFYGGARTLRAGEYLFEKAEGSLAVARRLSMGDHGLVAVRVLLPEGSSSKDIGRILAQHLQNINAEMFTHEAKTYEGYLFPDTYFFAPTATSGEVISVLRKTFNEKAIDLRRASTGTPPFTDVVVMASLIEEEARLPEDKHIVSGILWKRLKQGMRLQVDAPFAYLLGKASHELSAEDLEIDSPYNTYRYEGLPPSPISNPGIESLEAAINPQETPYWFYLSDNDGMLHYAITYEEHLKNKRQYLD